jgi:glycosyltransferase involved in cell wall biosynthesis
VSKSAVVLVKDDEYWLPYALLASEGFFDRYVIYDVGSTDRTSDIIRWFTEKNKGTYEFFVRQLPMVPPIVQGAFRNSQFAEARTDWIFMLDADELYSPYSYQNICAGIDEIAKNPYTLYGIVPRIEVCEGLGSAYGLDRKVSHHRVYHRTAIFTGPHPGEAPLVEQRPKNEYWIKDATCYHFHNTARSTKDAEVPKRIERRSRGTYHPGEAKAFDLFRALPILKNKIEDFEPNPVLKNLQNQIV